MRDLSILSDLFAGQDAVCDDRFRILENENSPSAPGPKAEDKPATSNISGMQ